jgi:Cellulase (glycosyl hydrolase family 5)
MFGRLRNPVSAGAVVLCVLAWLAASSAATPGRGARPAASGVLGGVNITGLNRGAPLAQADRDITWAHSLNAKVVRIDLPWSVMEPRGPGKIDARGQAFADRLVADATAAGIRVIMMVESTPCWASTAPPAVRRRCTSRHTGPANAWPPRVPGDFAAFTAYLAQRYGADLAAIEIWNEPDQINQHYFAGPDKAKRYAALLRAAYPAIKRADPSLPVLAGSLVGSNGVFLRALYAAGIKGHYDGLAVHYYDLTLGSLRSIHEVQLANGDSTRLWLDEFGWSSCWPRYRIQQEQSCVTKGIQATNLSDLMRLLARTPYVAAAVVYKLQGSTSEDFGVLTASGARKPAFDALATALDSPLGGLVAPLTLSLRQAGSGLLASGSAPPGDLMRVEVFQGSLLRFWAVFTLDRFDRFSIHLPPQLGVSGLRVRVFQYWSGPARAVQRSI